MKRIFFVIIFGVILSGCGNPSGPMRSEIQSSAADAAAKEFHPFLVYKDKGTRENHYIPSGFMPDGKCVMIQDTWKEKCYEGTSCIKVDYDVACSAAGQKWVGVYWLNPANNWGQQKGGYNLTGATQLKFWARGEKGGEQVQEFKMGGILGDYPDSDMAMIGPVVLTNEWRQYSIDLRGKDLSYISGGFSWATNTDVNPEGCVFYLDNIQFE